MSFGASPPTADRLRVTFLLPAHSRKPSGGVRVVYEYANGLVARGHSVTVVHAALLEPRQYSRPLYPRREARVVARGLSDLARPRPAGVQWQAVDPRVRLIYVPTLAAGHVPDGDVVVATSWRTAESIDRYPAAKGARHYLIQHYETWDAPRARVDRTWRLPLRRIVIARWLAEEGRRLGVDVMRIPNAIDHDRFQVQRPVADRPPRVAMLWSPARVKGGDVGIEALELARQARPDLRAVLFGVRPRPPDLPEWIDYRGDPPQEELAGDVYNGSAVYLCPSWSEGWHLPPAEAMACGCALVTTDQGGVRDYALPGRTAVLAPVGSAASLAHGIVRLLDDDGERRRLAEAGTELIRTFSWDRSVAAFEDVVRESARETPRRRR